VEVNYKFFLFFIITIQAITLQGRLGSDNITALLSLNTKKEIRIYNDTDKPVQIELIYSPNRQMLARNFNPTIASHREVIIPLNEVIWAKKGTGAIEEKESINSPIKHIPDYLNFHIAGAHSIKIALNPLMQSQEIRLSQTTLNGKTIYQTHIITAPSSPAASSSPSGVNSL